MSGYKGFGDYLRSYREKAKLTQPELAKALGVQPQTIWRWEHGEREPSLDILKKLCEVLGCTESELLSGSEGEKIKITLVYDWDKMKEGKIDMEGNDFELVLGSNGRVGLKGAGLITSAEAIDEFLARVKEQLTIALDAQIRRGAIQGA